jgi:glycosyltransferase involved in cell wall biosynthesis
MSGNLPVVCVFGLQNVNLKSGVNVPRFETGDIDCRCYLTDDDFDAIIARDRPQAIASFGDPTDYPNLMRSPFEIRKMWLNFPNTNDMAKAGAQIFHCFVQNALKVRDDFPLVTVFTPAYRTGAKIERPLNSLKAQTYRDWEWVIMDDSDDDGETFEMLSKMAADDFRIRVFREHRHSGVIGRVKRNACMLGRGKYLVELDHDDELADEALDRVQKAFKSDPEIGFVYTDFAELFEDGSAVSYGEGKGEPPYSDWGHGYGSYREEKHGGVTYKVVNAPNINAKTIRHIVAAPNHIRAWRSDVYRKVGGHKDLVHVADDYELMVRTFLETRMARVPHMCYLQYRNFDSGNTHRARNHEIQRLVRYFSQFYDGQIHERLLELGVEDFIWQEGQPSFVRMSSVKNPPEESHCTIIV